MRSLVSGNAQCANTTTTTITLYLVPLPLITHTLSLCRFTALPLVFPWVLPNTITRFPCLWLCHLLVFKLMFSSGAVKLKSKCKESDRLFS